MHENGGTDNDCPGYPERESWTVEIVRNSFYSKGQEASGSSPTRLGSVHLEGISCDLGSEVSRNYFAEEEVDDAITQRQSGIDVTYVDFVNLSAFNNVGASSSCP